jgi:hypothetical protein
MPPKSSRSPGRYPDSGLGSRHQKVVPTAESLLGASHPLVAVLYACQTTLEAGVAAAAVQATAVGLWWAGVSFGRALSIGAGIVQLVVGLRWTSLRLERRDRCRDLLIGGHEHLPLEAVAHERRRLLNRGYQQQLARSLDEFARLATAAHSGGSGCARPLCSRRVLAVAQPQLKEVAGLLRANGTNLRGVALLDRLITCGSSPLYGEQPGALCEELARARYLLT